MDICIDVRVVILGDGATRNGPCEAEGFAASVAGVPATFETEMGAPPSIGDVQGAITGSNRIVRSSHVLGVEPSLVSVEFTSPRYARYVQSYEGVDAVTAALETVIITGAVAALHAVRLERVSYVGAPPAETHREGCRLGDVHGQPPTFITGVILGGEAKETDGPSSQGVVTGETVRMVSEVG